MLKRKSITLNGWKRDTPNSFGSIISEILHLGIHLFYRFIRRTLFRAFHYHDQGHSSLRHLQMWSSKSICEIFQIEIKSPNRSLLGWDNTFQFQIETLFLCSFAGNDNLIPILNNNPQKKLLLIFETTSKEKRKSVGNNKYYINTITTTTWNTIEGIFFKLVEKNKKY